MVRKGEGIVGWEEQHDDGDCKLYSSLCTIMFKCRSVRWARHVKRVTGGKISAYRILVVHPEGKRPLGRRWHRWEDSINKDFVETVLDV